MFDSLFRSTAGHRWCSHFLLCAFALGGLAIFRRHILPRLKFGPGRPFRRCHDAGSNGFLRIGCGLDCGQRVADIRGHRPIPFPREPPPSVSSTGPGHLSKVSLRSELRRKLRKLLEYIIETWPLDVAARCRVEGVEQANDVEAKLFT